MHSQLRRELSSAGLEHLPYKQRVGGSNPSAPTRTKEAKDVENDIFFFFAVRRQIYLVDVLQIKRMGLQPLAQCSSCKGPHGEWMGKRLSGASMGERSSQSLSSHKNKRSKRCRKRHLLFFCGATANLFVGRTKRHICRFFIRFMP